MESVKLQNYKLLYIQVTYTSARQTPVQINQDSANLQPQSVSKMQLKHQITIAHDLNMYTMTNTCTCAISESRYCSNYTLTRDLTLTVIHAALCISYHRSDFTTNCCPTDHTSTL